MFVNIENEGTSWFTPTSSTVEMFSDYECGGAFSMGADFFLVSFSFDFAFTISGSVVGSGINKKDVTSVPAPSKTFNLKQ